MGRVVVEVRIENIQDLFDINRGLMGIDDLRFVEVSDALVDTGATNLSMPAYLISQLGLTLVNSRQARTAGGTQTVRIFGPVKLIIQGRECNCDVTELPDDCPVLIGQIPLEALDFVVDMPGHRLIGNPAHNGEHMVELY